MMPELKMPSVTKFIDGTGPVGEEIGPYLLKQGSASMNHQIEIRTT